MNENSKVKNEKLKNPSTELIMRSLQKDNEYIQHINKKNLSLVDALSHLFSFNHGLYSQNFDVLSNLIFYFINYFERKDKLTPGEEYTNIGQYFKVSEGLEGSGRKPISKILLYILILSFKKLIMKYLHNTLVRLCEKNINRHENNQNIENIGIKSIYNISSFPRLNLIGRVILKLCENFSNFEFILEKLEEYQYCLLFIDGKYFDFIQRLFRFNYISYNKQANIRNELINRDGFKFFGYLMLTKLLLEFYQIIKIAIKTYKLELDKYNKYNKEISNDKFDQSQSDQSDQSDENSKKLNVKLKKIPLSKQPDSGDAQNNCLLCLDIRKNSSTTPCGHLFCWSCITKYLEVNSNCPFCRQECYPQNILQLRNLI